MLHDIYTDIKGHLSAADEDATIKGIEWYNVQYEGSIATTPRLFVEFPDALNFELLSKDGLKRADVKIRLHVVTQAITLADGVIDDSVSADHEAVALWVKEELDRYVPTNNSCGILRFTAWQHWHKYRGWMVTFVEFVARK